MPQPVPYIINNIVLIMDELSYDREELKANHDRDLPKLTEEQRKIYDEITDVVLNKKGGVFFVYDFGGTKKIFLWRLLSAAIRYKGPDMFECSVKWDSFYITTRRKNITF